MSMTADEIASHPALQELIRRQSQALLMAYEANPRQSSVFATQQRWLMGHIGFALYFKREDGEPGLLTSRFLDMTQAYAVASRNTADAFIKELLNYGYIEYCPETDDRRARPVRPSQSTIDAIHGWVMVHLATLDGLDGGQRLATYLATSDGLDRIEPLICDGLLSSHAIREPADTFSLFTWLNNGGIIMDRLIAGLEEATTNAEQLSTSITSITEMGLWLQLSRSHLARKLREAESLGSIGWRGKRGSSVMWVSRGFLGEIAAAQAAKLAVIDAAYEASLSPKIG
ncbi:hypothetical protein IHE39_19320 [Aminobacter carboxidus]|uniref:MarR family transcriptional regulator n=2 Tax=Aminobacter carboxidus TaxID=376165 RepID=A0ABR9GS15_9HYPH|nr:hypothetical protein [Aminobacter carboxidus]MBE1206448.1 hypothetical protein [Aminobacter carboxidus]